MCRQVRYTQAQYTQATRRAQPGQHREWSADRHLHGRGPVYRDGHEIPGPADARRTADRMSAESTSLPAMGRWRDEWLPSVQYLTACAFLLSSPQKLALPNAGGVPARSPPRTGSVTSQHGPRSWLDHDQKARPLSAACRHFRGPGIRVHAGFLTDRLESRLANSAVTLSSTVCLDCSG